MTPPLSVYIRTLNEAATLSETLAAARRISDDIVVVDSGSNDDTVAIAEAAGARVIRQPWLGWGRQKRVGEDACRRDWLFDLDADEIVTPALAAEISALFANGPPREQAFRTPMQVVHRLGGRHIALGRVARMKLYDRRAVRAPDHATWDQFDPPRGLRIGALRSTIEHRAFRDAAHLTAKLNSYSSGVAAEKPLKPPPWLALRVLFGLPVYFLKRYLFEGLIFSGVYGFAFSIMTAHGRWLRDVKMYERARASKA